MLAQTIGSVISKPGITPQKPTVRLPEGMDDFQEGKGYVPSNIFENRTSARLRVRCDSTLVITGSPLFTERIDCDYQVMMKDLSKNGIGLLSPLQLYPLESIRISLLGRQISASVVRCRKLGPYCYEIGSRIESVLST